MSLQTRGLVFATFFGNCLVVGLLVASLTTDHWIQSSAAKRNSNVTSPEAVGKVNFGLFSGVKRLNVGYGPRDHPIDVMHFMRTEPSSINYWLWLGAALGVGFGLLASTLAAIASVLKSASLSKKRGTMILLFVSNFASAISQLLAFVCWMLQFYQYLTHNVLTLANRNDKWYSTGMANLGMSFYFVVAGIFIVLINLTFLFMAVRLERKERMRGRHDDPAYDEKMQGAIMLY